MFKGCGGWEENINRGKGKMLISATWENNVLQPGPSSISNYL
jgi:hypothetical protein